MDHKEYSNNLREAEIPSSFYSFKTDQPFTHCIDCGLDLRQSGIPYFIEKAFRRYQGFSAHDVTYEFAMCLQCAEHMKNEISKESQEKMQQFMMDNIDNTARMHQMKDYDPQLQPEKWMDACMITNEPIDQQSEYVIYGFFKGNRMMVADFPYAMGMTAMDEMTDLLSNKTLGEMDDFMGKHFSGPPEVNELLKPRRPVFF